MTQPEPTHVTRILITGNGIAIRRRSLHPGVHRYDILHDSIWIPMPSVVMAVHHETGEHTSLRDLPSTAASSPLPAVVPTVLRIAPNTADEALRDAFATLRYAERALRFRGHADVARMVRAAADIA